METVQAHTRLPTSTSLYDDHEVTMEKGEEERRGRRRGGEEEGKEEGQHSMPGTMCCSYRHTLDRVTADGGTYMLQGELPP